MRQWKLSANAAFFGAQRDRYTQYQPNRTLEEKFALVAQLDLIEGIELKYPFDLENVPLARRLLEQYGLELSAVNVDIKDATFFRFGALSAQDANARDLAATRLCRGMDIAAELGAGLVTTCPLAEGYDYPFEIDYGSAWRYFINTVQQVASHRDDVKLALEYQPHDMQAKPLLNNVGKMLHICAEVDRPNLGANLDVGHSFAAGEAPAEAATLLASKGKLFYMHSNDNTGDGVDWDMISGSVHFWHWLELLFTLDRIGYEGWLGADIAAHQLDAVRAFGANALMLQRMIAFLERMDLDEIARLVEEDGKSPEVYAYLSSHLIPET